MTFWPLTNSDFPTDQTFHQFHDLYTELDLHRIMSGFHGAFVTGMASQQGTLTLPDTWFRPPFWDLLMLQLLRPNSSNLPCLYSTFHLEYPLVLSRFCSYRSSFKYDSWFGIHTGKRTEIWLSPMTKTLTPRENSKKLSDTKQKSYKNLYTRSNDSLLTGVVKPLYGIWTFPLTAIAVGKILL